MAKDRSIERNRPYRQTKVPLALADRMQVLATQSEKTYAETVRDACQFYLAVSLAEAKKKPAPARAPKKAGKVAGGEVIR